MKKAIGKETVRQYALANELLILQGVRRHASKTCHGTNNYKKPNNIGLYLEREAGSRVIPAENWKPKVKTWANCKERKPNGNIMWF